MEVISVEKLIIDGVKSKLKKHLGLTTDPVFLTSSAREVVASAIQRMQKDKTLTYPMLFYSLQTGSVNRSSYSADKLARYAPYGKVNSTGTAISSLELTPVELVFDVIYCTNDFYVALAFFARWLKAGPKGALNFSALVEGVRLDIQVRPEESITAPVKEVSLDSPSHFEYQSTLTVSGYVSGPIDEALVNVSIINTLTQTVLTTQDADDLQDAQLAFKITTKTLLSPD